ncbi:MAG: phospholipase, partial [Alistipes sp.]
NFKMTIGGNVSSTAFNQAFIGLSYETIGRVAHTFNTDLYLGPIYSWGSIGGRTDFYMWKPLFLDYSYKFSVKNLRHGTFGNVNDVDNALQVKNSESFFSLCAGMPLTHSSVLYLRANGGHINYRYDSDVLGAYDTDHSRLSYFGLKLGLERNTLDRQYFPSRGSHLTASGIYITGRDKYKPFDKVDFLKLTSRQWLGARFTWDKYFNLPAIRWFSLGLNFDAVYTNHPDFTTQISTLMSMPAYEPIPQAKMLYMPDFYARRFVAGGVIPTFYLLPNFCLRTGFYAMYRDRRNFSPLRDLSTAKDGYDDSMHYIAEMSFVYHTQIGPVSLSLTKYGLNNWRNMYLTFNFGYAIFAPRGTFY